MVGCLTFFGLQRLLLPDRAPVVLEAYWSMSTDTLILYFDREIFDAGFDSNEWVARGFNSAWNGLHGSKMTDRQYRVKYSDIGAVAGGPWYTYKGGNKHLFGSSGLPVARIFRKPMIPIP